MTHVTRDSVRFLTDAAYRVVQYAILVFRRSERSTTPSQDSLIMNVFKVIMFIVTRVVDRVETCPKVPCFV